MHLISHLVNAACRIREPNENNAIFMILLMVATPALTLQTGLLEKDSAPEELENSIRSTSGTTPLPDCSLTDVNVTEVYHDSSSDWIEIYNSGSAACDLGDGT